MTTPSGLSYREIPLTYGKVAIVSAHRYEQLSAINWSARKHKGRWYAEAQIKDKDGIYRTVRMHRYIMGLSNGDPRKVDHRNHVQTLNNTDENLRLATQAEQVRNRGIFKNNTTGFKGVYLRKTGKYRAGIRINKVLTWIGTRDTAEECARLYDRAAIKHFGEFACLNFPRSDYEQAA